MKVGVVYAGQQQVYLRCEVEEPATVSQVIEQSGILQLCPDIDLAQQKVGVFGKFIALDKHLSDGDRIEIYRKITRVLEDDDDEDDDD